MRDITFRGMDIMGVWHYGLLCVISAKSWTYDEGTYISNNVGMPMAYKVRPETAGQYTGLHDKKGIPIYEGDLVQFQLPLGGFWGNTPNIKIGQVVYDTDYASFVAQWEYSKNQHDELLGELETEIIGNIYQHPHLLQ